MSAWVVPGYTTVDELGHGGSGHVVSAVHDESGQRVAIKYLDPRLFRDPGYLADFRSEAEVLKSLHVSQVVHLLDYVEAPGQGAAIVMELVNGVSLEKMISAHGATSPESALLVLKGSLLGLAAAHQAGIVHRDYKPANVLVEAGNSKLSDFGIAVKAGRKAAAAGTAHYMPPEQWRGEPATPASDIYAATAVFFECLTGKTPFSGSRRRLMLAHQTAAVPVAMVEEPLRGLIDRGMAKEPGERPSDAMEFAAELSTVAAGAHGPDWEERGRDQLAERAAGMLPLLLPGGQGRVPGGSFADTLLDGPRHRKKDGPRHRKKAAFAAATGILIAIAGASAVLARQAGTSAATKVAATASPALAASPPSTPASSASAAPVISVALSSKPGSPATVACGSDPPPFTVLGAISADRATAVTYHWPASPPVTTQVAAGATVTVTDTVTPGSANWSGTDTLTVTAPSSVTRSISLTVSCAFPALKVATASLRDGTDGVRYSATVNATGGDGTYTWTASGLPDGLAMSASGVISGIPSTAPMPFTPAPFLVTVTVTDGHGQATSATLTLRVGFPPPQVTTASLPDGTDGAAYSAQLTATGGDRMYTWTASGLPDGLTMDSNGVISGVLQAAGTFTVAVTVTDGQGQTGSATLSLQAAFAPLQVTTTSLPEGHTSTSLDYSAQLTATGGDGMYTWTASGLPDGLTVDSGGLISGNVAMDAGWYTITVTVTDGEGQTVPATLSLFVHVDMG
jgi:serine/threonine-protein kinase